MTPDPTAVIDVRTIERPQRHPTIMAAFDALAPGEAVEVVADHAPEPLRRQFENTREGAFTWAYAEEGPEVWRVRIGRA